MPNPDITSYATRHRSAHEPTGRIMTIPVGDK
jgi:hypothetical protein